MIINAIIFYIFAVLALLAAIFAISAASPVKSAISMIFCLFCMAMLYFTLGAHFVGVIQILVYAGAIMVLFLFVVLLLEKRDCETIEDDYISAFKTVNVFTAVFLFIVLAASLYLFSPSFFPPESAGYGSIKTFAPAIFKKYIFVFEALSILILTAIAGVVLLTAKTGTDAVKDDEKCMR